MKKNLLLLAKILVCQLATAQIQLEDFEAASPKLTWQPLDGTEILHGKFTAPTANPAAGGANTSVKVGCYQKGISPFSTLQATAAAGFDLTAFAKLELDVLPPAAAVGEVVLQVFSAAGNRELKAKTSTPGQWQTLVFDFSPFPNLPVFSEIRLIFNFGAAAEGENWCLDNLRQTQGSGNPCSGVAPVPSIVDDFECQRNYSKIFYGATDIAVVDNPFPTTENPSAKVGEYKDPANSQWAGLGFEFPAAINLTTLNHLEIKIWSPAAGVPMLFKLEGGSGTGTEFWRDVPEANRWINYRIDFTSAKPFNHRKLVVFCNGGVSGAAATYYFDDIRWTAATSVFDADGAAGRLSIFPNPTADFFKIQNLDNSKIGRLVVSDLLGRQVAEFDGGAAEFDVSHLFSGTYSVSAFDSRGLFLGAGLFFKN